MGVGEQAAGSGANTHRFRRHALAHPVSNGHDHDIKHANGFSGSLHVTYTFLSQQHTSHSRAMSYADDAARWTGQEARRDSSLNHRNLTMSVIVIGRGC
jgi:hypothetical protein